MLVANKKNINPRAITWLLHVGRCRWITGV